MVLSADQALKLVKVMDRRLKRSDFRHVPGVEFHSSWDRATGRARLASTKVECIVFIVGVLCRKSSMVNGELLGEWLDQKIPDWMEQIGLQEKADGKERQAGS